MGHLFRDLRYSVRLLAKSPVFTVAAVLTLALGIGLNAATFSAVHGILLRPLGGVAAPEELVQVYRQWPGMDYGSVSIPHYQDLRDRAKDVFEDVAAYSFTPMALATGGRSERIMGMLVSANFFQTYGVTPRLGRVFLPAVEDRGPGAHPVVVLGHGFWQSRFGSDPGVVGRTLQLNGRPFDVVGVAPPSFKGPVTFAAIPVYVPLMMQREIQPGIDLIEARGSNSFTAIARLRDGRTIDEARQALDVVLAQLGEEHPDDYDTQLGHTLVLQNDAGLHPTFRDAQVGMSAVMMTVVALLLLIACVNVANLFLARARERQREMGVRLSLGAGRRRIVQQLLTESFVFSVLAGLAGLGLARLAVGFLDRVRPPIDGPWDFTVEMDSTVLLFTVSVSLAAGFLFGLAPALSASRSDMVAAVRGVGKGKGGRSGMSGALVVVQMALSVLLLISSGLFLRSLQGATEIDPGFDDPAHLVMASVDPGLQGYDEDRSREMLDRLLEEAGARPEVAAVGLVDQAPLGLGGSDRGVEIPGYEFGEGELRSIKYADVSEGYLEALGTRLLEGRTFTRQDDADAPPVVIVNRRFAERFWPDEPALGKIVRTAGEEREVIGVVETGKYRSLGEAPTEFMFLPHRERFSSGMTLVARTRVAPEDVLQTIQGIVHGLDADMPVFDTRTMRDHLGIALMPARLGGAVLGLFGLLGLALAAVGIYGVMAYSVARRRRELGIRVALGADRSSVLGLVLGQGARLALLGVALGLLAAAGASKMVEGLLYNVDAYDPVAFIGVPLLLIAVAMLAVYLPARRAAGVEPVRALRTE
ncbi:MAG TPA: ABC transporter permease [Thermoanaerobaculia bacterium]|nr:ABC transporter permease [Thermoanaerobaculia bacterium]